MNLTDAVHSSAKSAPLSTAVTWLTGPAGLGTSHVAVAFAVQCTRPGRRVLLVDREHAPQERSGGKMATKPKAGPAGVSTIQAAARTYRLARTRARAALRSLPKDERESHGWALGALVHLLEAHRPADETPIGFLVGRDEWRRPEVHWAAALLGGWPLVECTAPDCTQPRHVTLLSTPGGRAGGDRR